MSEFIVRETAYPGAIKQEVVGELIRCKDCKHWSEGYVYSYCQRLLNMGVLKLDAIITAENDFCSKPERREEGDQE